VKISGEEFRSHRQDFAPAIIFASGDQLSELPKKYVGRVWSSRNSFSILPARRGSHALYQRERMNYEKTIAFLKDLKDVPFLKNSGKPSAMEVPDPVDEKP